MIVKDKAIEPFYLDIDFGSISVRETITDKNGKTINKERFKNEQLGIALGWIAKNKFLTENADKEFTLSEYYRAETEYTNQIEAAFKMMPGERVETTNEEDATAEEESEAITDLQPS